MRVQGGTTPATVTGSGKSWAGTADVVVTDLDLDVPMETVKLTEAVGGSGQARRPGVTDISVNTSISLQSFGRDRGGECRLRGVEDGLHDMLPGMSNHLSLTRSLDSATWDPAE